MLHHIFSLINFAFATFVAINCVVVVATPQLGTVFSFMGGVILTGPFAAWAIIEWRRWYRKKADLELLVGVICGVFSGFTFFAFTATLFESGTEIFEEGFYKFLLILLGVAVYFGFVARYRIRRYKYEIRAQLG